MSTETTSTSLVNRSIDRYLCCFYWNRHQNHDLGDIGMTPQLPTDSDKASEGIHSDVNKSGATRRERNPSSEIYSCDTNESDSTDNITLADLEQSSPYIEKELQDELAAFESQFRAYEEMENSSLEQVGPTLIKTLLELRDNPDAFVVSADPAIRELARQRTSLANHMSLPRVMGEGNGTAPVDLRSSRRQSIAVTRNPILPHPTTLRRGSVSDTQPRGISSHLSSSHHHFEDTVVTNSREASVLLQRSKAQLLCSTTASGDSPCPEGRKGTHVLSLKWAGRLAEVSPTQGHISRQVSKQGNLMGLKVRPKWPQWLSDALYDVIKINRYGKRQRRTIKLTEYYMANIKGGCAATRIIPYKSISKAALLDSKSFVVEFVLVEEGERENDSDSASVVSLHYESLLACHIVQQLTTRAQVRMGLEKIASYAAHVDDTGQMSLSPRMGVSVNATAAMIEAIGEENAKDLSDMTQFARVLGKRTCNRLNSIGNSDYVVDAIDVEDPSKNDDTQRLNRLISIEPGSGEGKVQNAVQRLILDASTPEGSTAKHFIKEFPVIPLESDLTQLRHFIDGMFEYILETHSVELSLLLNSDASFRMSDMSSLIDGVNDPGATGVVNSVHVDLDQAVITSLSYLTYSVVEEAMFLSLQEKVISCFAPPGSILVSNHFALNGEKYTVNASFRSAQRSSSDERLSTSRGVRRVNGASMMTILVHPSGVQRRLNWLELSEIRLHHSD